MEATFDVINEAKSIFNKEMEALVKTRDSLGEDFENLVEIVRARWFLLEWVSQAILQQKFLQHWQALAHLLSSCILAKLCTAIWEW